MLTIFEIKPLVTIPLSGLTGATGEMIIDLTYPSIRYNYDPYITNVIPVTEQMAMRPDLVSRTAYGTTEYWDLILKYNAVSNPFSLGPGDILLIPSLDDMRDQVAPSAVQDTIADSIRQQYIDPSKAAQQDPNLAIQEKNRKAAQIKLAQGTGVPSVNNLPPNIAEIGDREITIKGGKIYFGPDISKNKRACEKPLSKSEFINRLIQNRLNTGLNG